MSPREVRLSTTPTDEAIADLKAQLKWGERMLASFDTNKAAE